jgi:hypothetical protein
MEEWVVLHVTKRWARTKFVAYLGYNNSQQGWRSFPPEFAPRLKGVKVRVHIWVLKPWGQNNSSTKRLGTKQGLECLQKCTL